MQNPSDAQPASLKSAKERTLNPDVPAEDLTALTNGLTAFSADLYRQLSSQEGNLFFSPYSISLALAMTQAGAAGETRAQIDAALHYTLEGERLHAAFNALDQELARRATEVVESESEANPFQLKVANSLWGQRDYPFRSEYLDLLATNYGAGLQVVDFKQNTEQARQAINDWIAQATEQKIKDIIPEGGLNAMSRLVLANAIYFNASWLTPFETEFTKDEAFNLLDGSQKTVPMMHKTDRYGYVDGDTFQLVELPYISQNLVMDVLVPDEGQLAVFEQSLDAERLKSIFEQIGSSEVELGLPRFKFEASTGLSSTLKAMGMQAAFDPNSADFSNLADTDELFLQDVLHKAYISVDEAGTEAAAATVVMVGATGAQLEPVKLTVDRPFLFLIRDTGTGAILFFGRVTNP